jgi:hypothetical protein
VIRADNRQVLALCIVVGLCCGLAGPAVATSLDSAGNSGEPVATPVGSQFSLDSLNSDTNDRTGRSDSSYATDREEIERALAKKNDKSKENMGTVLLNLKYKKYGKKLDFKVVVTKVNRSVFKMVHTHEVPGKKKKNDIHKVWYYYNTSLWKYPEKMESLTRDGKRKTFPGWPGQIDDLSKSEKKQLKQELTTSNKVFETKVRPFIQTIHTPKVSNHDLGEGKIIVIHPPWSEHGLSVIIHWNLLIEKIIKLLIVKPIRGILNIFSGIDDLIYGMPAPGKPFKPTTWVSQNGWWSAVYMNYGVMAGLAMPLLLAEIMIAIDKMYPRERAKRLTELGKAFTVGVLFGIPITAFTLHFTNKLTMAIAPNKSLSILLEGDEFIYGLIFGTIILIFKAVALIAGSIVIMMEHLLMYIILAFWPLFWALRVQSNQTLARYGNRGISMFFLLVMLKIAQAMLMRFSYALYEAGVDLSLGGLLTKIFQLVVMIGMMYVALIKLPLYIMGQITSDIPLMGGAVQANKGAVEGAEKGVKGGFTNAAFGGMLPGGSGGSSGSVGSFARIDSGGNSGNMNAIDSSGGSSGSVPAVDSSGSGSGNVKTVDGNDGTVVSVGSVAHVESNDGSDDNISHNGNGGTAYNMGERYGNKYGEIAGNKANMAGSKVKSGVQKGSQKIVRTSQKGVQTVISLFI